MSGLTIMREPVTNESYISIEQATRYAHSIDGGHIMPERNSDDFMRRAMEQMSIRMALDIEDMIINGLPDVVIEEVIEEYIKSFPTANSVRKVRFR